MKLPLYMAVSAGGILLLAGEANATVYNYNAVRVYDGQDAGSTTDIRFNANGNALASSGAADYAGFKANVATAFDNGNGGVINWDTLPTGLTAAAPDIAAAPTDYRTATYGVSGTKTLQIGCNQIQRASASYGSAGKLSGTLVFDLEPQTDTAGVFIQNYALSFGPITGGAAGEAVTAVGFGALSRNNFASNVGMFVTYSDGSTSSTLSRYLTSDGTSTGTAAVNAADTFYGFVAPAGLSITSLSVSRSLRVPFDDLGFITSVVPEPASLALLSLAALGLSRRRRRA